MHKQHLGRSVLSVFGRLFAAGAGDVPHYDAPVFGGGGKDGGVGGVPGDFCYGVSMTCGFSTLALDVKLL